MKTKKYCIYIEEWAIEKIEKLLKSEYCKHRGFKMKIDDVIMEALANFEPLNNVEEYL